MSSKRSRSLLVRGLKHWLKGLSGRTPRQRRPVRPGLEVLERREVPSVDPFLVRDIRTGDLGSDPRSVTTVGGTLFFVANDASHGAELWKSDGTSTGTTLVKDIHPGIN